MSPPVHFFNDFGATDALSVLSLVGEPGAIWSYANGSKLESFTAYGKGFVPLERWNLGVPDCLMASTQGLPTVDGMTNIPLKDPNLAVAYDCFFVDGPRTYHQPHVGRVSTPHQLFMAWGGLNRPFEKALNTPLLPEQWNIWASPSAKGVLLGRALVNGSLRNRFVFVTKIVRRRYQGHAESSIDLSFRHVDTKGDKWPRGMNGHWFSIMERAAQGFDKHCEASDMGNEPTYWSTVDQDFGAMYQPTIDSCSSWRAALANVDSAWELMAVCKHFGPSSGFHGTLYKQAKRMVETFLSEQKNKQGALVRKLWPLAQQRLLADQ
ncbi:MAG TPA: hypothetical protein VFO38_06560 [Candidatus Saccharimonadales bacterium]|nr:hypothetical protein [Candidatus Saccharimonadales bacterium]